MAGRLVLYSFLWNNHNMLISLHLPKTAGSSFLASLEQHFGDGLLRDYADAPLNKSKTRRNVTALYRCLLNGFRPFRNVECIHGHYLPLKYMLCRKTTLITWMRDPVERMVSHYHYCLRHYAGEQTPPLHKRIVEEEWSLERFCLAPELRNIYCQFTWGVPLTRFDFIGITEFYDSDVSGRSKPATTGRNDSAS
jgi:hypothetical protein